MNTGQVLLRRGATAAFTFVVSAAALGAAPGGTAQAAPAVLAAPHSVAAPSSGCTAPSVAVAVNFQHFGGTAQRGCATYTDSLTGWSLLQHAGFVITGLDAYPDTFVCKINNEPAGSCATTPPASSSWSYWHAGPGATRWTHTALGAASAHPQAGSADAWTFGDTNSPPPFSPQSVLPAAATRVPATPGTAGAGNPPRAPLTSPAAGTDEGGQSGTARSGSDTTPTPRNASTVPNGATAPASVASGAAPRPASASPSAQLSSSPGSVTIHDVQPSAAAHTKSNNSPWPAIGGLIAVAVIAAGGAAAAFRRRRGAP